MTINKWVVLTLDVDDTYAFDDVLSDKYPDMMNCTWLAKDSEWESKAAAMIRFNELKEQTSNTYLVFVEQSEECI